MSPDTQLIVGLCFAGLVLVALGALFVACWIVVRVSDETRRMMHACDERVKAVYAVSEKSFSRIMAWAFPNSHRLYREAQGPVIEGAQYAAKPFPDAGPPTAASAEASKAQAMLFQASRAREEARAMNGTAQPMDVATQLGFEEQPGPR